MLDEEAARILRSKSFAHLALDDEGSPHVSPVWVDVDDHGLVVVNTAEGRVKSRRLAVGSPVALSAADPENPYHYVGVRGRVVKRTNEGADAVIDRLANKYLGVDSYPYRQPGERRVTILIEPERVFVN
ncbi:MAG: TIGR03618 family F420-dependent PPOX class oxidoreductase [Acidobacteria bacterium]|nr:TIGR03618 family F420-dependent PPOX class oxidoreductase [Acidobacteriota bacterium]